MSQYTKLFAAARIPQVSRDEMVYYPHSRCVILPIFSCRIANSSETFIIRHMAVLSHNHFYAVDIITEDGSVVPEKDIQRQLQQILNESAPSGTRELGLGVLTADWR